MSEYPDETTSDTEGEEDIDGDEDEEIIGNGVIREIQVPDDDRKTSEQLTLTELVQMASIRIANIDNGSKIFLDDYSHLTNSEQIAYEEIRQRTTPLILKRVVKVEDGILYYELWKVREMKYPIFKFPDTQAKKESLSKCLT